MTAQPGYAPPKLQDLVLMYIAFDILILDGRDLCSLPLSVRMFTYDACCPHHTHTLFCPCHPQSTLSISVPIAPDYRIQCSAVDSRLSSGRMSLSSGPPSEAMLHQC